MSDATHATIFSKAAGPGEDLKASTIRGGAVMLAAEGVDFFLRFASMVVLARLLLPEHFGVIAMVTAITTIAERIKDLGLSVATVQRDRITHEQVSNLFWLNVAIGAILMLVVAALGPALAAFYNEPRLLPIALAIATSFLWSGLVVQHQALLRRQMRFGTLAIIQIAASVVSLAVAVGMALADFGYWALVAREVLRNLLLALGTWIAMPWLPSRPSRGTGVRSMVMFGGDVTAFNLIWFFSTSIDQILVGRLFGAVSLGLYRQGVNLVLTPIGQLSYPVNSVAEATLSRLQHHPEEYRRYYSRIVMAMSSVTMPLAVFLAVFAEEIILVALGVKWQAATPYFQALAIAVFLRPAGSTAGFVLVTSGKSRKYLAWGFLSALGLIACVGVGALWGPSGVATAQVVYTYALVIPLLAWALKGTPVRLRDVGAAVVRPLAASLGMAAPLYFVNTHLLPETPLLALVLGAAVGVPAYLLIWILLPGGREELLRIMARLRSIVASRSAGAV